MLSTLCVLLAVTGCAVTWWCEDADLLHAAHLVHRETHAHCTALNPDLSLLIPQSAVTAPPLPSLIKRNNVMHTNSLTSFI